MNITSTSSLKNSILAADSQVDTTILEDLCHLVRKHQLKWVPSPKHGGGAFFIMSQLSVAKGLESNDYRDHWANNAIERNKQYKKDRKDEAISAVCGTTLPERVLLKSLSGKAFKLEGEQLANFKKSWQETWGENLGRINSLWVGDFLHAYSYLAQGKSEAAKDFQTLGSKAIETSASQDISKLQQEEKVTRLISEEDLQLQLIKLTGYSTVNFRFEVGIYNSFDTPDQASHRRWDWVERLPKVTKIYELKARTISENDVRSTIFDKHYLELAAQKYPNKPVEFIFCSPRGISWEAKALIEELMNGQEGYTNILGVKAKITFIDLQAIAQRLVNNILQNNPQEAWLWLLNQLRTTDLGLVTSKRTINQLNSQICELYEQGVLVRKSVNNVVLFPSNQTAA